MDRLLSGTGTALDLAVHVLDQHAQHGHWTPLYQHALRVAANWHTHTDPTPYLNHGCEQCDLVWANASRLQRAIPNTQAA